MVIPLIKTYKFPLSWLYLALILAAGIQQLWHPKELMDTAEYKDAILYIFNSDTLKLDPHLGRWMYVTRRTLGFPFLVNFLGDTGILITSLLAAIFSPVVISMLLEQNGIKIKNVWFWLFWVSQPLQFFYAALPMPEMICQLLVGLWFLFLLQKQNFLTGLTLGVLILIKPIFIVFLLPLIIVLLFKLGLRNFIFSQRFIRSTSQLFEGLNFNVIVIPIGFIFFIGLFNHSKWGVFHLSSISTTNFYEYNRYQALSEAEGREFADSLYELESIQLNQMSDFDPEKGELLRAFSTATLWDYPLAFMKMHLKGMLQMFMDPGRYDAMVFFGWPQTKGFLGLKNGHDDVISRPIYEWIYIVIFAMLNLIKFVILVWVSIKILKIGSNLHVHLFFPLCIVIMYAFAIGSVGTARYLVPIYPLMAYIVNYGISAVRSINQS